MTVAAWFALIGVLFVLMALSGTIFERLPISTGMLYLSVGFLLALLGVIRIDPLAHSLLLERITEVVVIVSLFTAGLKLQSPLGEGRWKVPVRLALLSMTLTVGLITAVGYFWLGLPPGAAVLLGAVLAPTDPVLASDVQVHNPDDGDQLRFGLTGEAGLNDGTAFPFVMLGLGLLGLHEIGEFGWRWFAVDTVWAIAGGLAIGGICGHLVGRLVLHLRRDYREAVGLDDFLSLGLVATSYGLALLATTYGFLAVFAAGVALRRIEQKHSEEVPSEEVEDAFEIGEEEEIATHPDSAPAYMASAVLGFNEQLERILVVGVVLIIGGLMHPQWFPPQSWWFVPLLLLVIRPISTTIGLIGSDTSVAQRAYIGWFGIRGVGSLYYLTFAIEHGLAEEYALPIVGLVLSTITASIFLHGISVSPLMKVYSRSSR